MTRLTIGLLAFAVAVPAAQAQELVRPEAPMDSLQQAYHDALIPIRDSLTAVNAALRALGRDLRNSHPRTVERRAQHLNRTCSNLITLVEGSQSVFDPRNTKPGIVDEVSAYRAALRALVRNLDSLCVNVFTPDHPHGSADSLRAWAPFHSSQLRSALREYNGPLGVLVRATDVNITPRVNRQ